MCNVKMKTGIFFMALSLGIASSAYSQECVYQSRTVMKNDIKISERSNIVRDVIDVDDNSKKCIVHFSVRINQSWKMATGEWEWSGNRPHQQACAKAVQLAEKEVIERVAERDISNEQVLICNDDERYEELKNIDVGTVGSIEQFRPHPEYKDSFYHRGAECRWIVDSDFTGTDIRKYEGVICETNPDKWVVVDKF